MRFLIVEDDVNVLHMLSNMVEDLDVANEIKTFTCPVKALEWARVEKIDVCVVDFLMPKLDGVSLIQKVKNHHPEVACIMASQVTDQKMISDAYENGALFFINKPLNALEVSSVVKLVVEKKNMEKALSNIKELLDGRPNAALVETNHRGKLERIFSNLGMMGEKGTYDLIKICDALCQSPTVEACAIEKWLDQCGERAQTVAQRMRRALSKGLHHLALIGIEDYGHELYVRYAYRLFDSESLSVEMAYIKGQQSKGGRPNLDHFIRGVVIEVKNS